MRTPKTPLGIAAELHNKQVCYDAQILANYRGLQSNIAATLSKHDTSRTYGDLPRSQLELELS